MASIKRGGMRHRLWNVLGLVALMPLLMAGNCDSGSGGDVGGLVSAIIDLVLSIINISS